MDTDQNLKVFAYNVKYLRKVFNLSKEQMASKIGVTVNQLNILEKGTVPSDVDVLALINVSNQFGISPQKLITQMLDK